MEFAYTSFERPSREEVRVVTFKAHYTFLEKVDRLANELGTKRSTLIRAALLKVLEEPPEKPYFIAAEMLGSRPYDISVKYLKETARAFI